MSKWKNKLEPQETLVSNQFIDHYMVSANGECVKVYLYLLRHPEVLEQPDGVRVIADALCNTESDVNRALEYWKKQGILEYGDEVQNRAGVNGNTKTGAGMFIGAGMTAGSGMTAGTGRAVNMGAAMTAATAMPEAAAGLGLAASVGMQNGASAQGMGVQHSMLDRSAYQADRVAGLSSDEEFAQLIYVVQTYRKKPLTPMECETFAYLYDGLKIAPELLEYVAEYCVQEGHTSIRYMETVALDWHKRGIATINEAKAYSEGFSKNSFAVMKALGQTGRAPATAEKELMDKWFREYGFTKEIVLEACNRTILSIHKPSFDYVDGILTAWNKAKVRTLQDVAALDEKRKNSKDAKKKDGVAAGQTGSASANTNTNSRNRFHNFDQHDYDYDEMMWKMIQNQ